MDGDIIAVYFDIVDYGLNGGVDFGGGAGLADGIECGGEGEDLICGEGGFSFAEGGEFVFQRLFFRLRQLYGYEFSVELCPFIKYLPYWF